MKTKNAFIFAIIRSIIIILILFSFFYSNNGVKKIMLIPFIVCGFSSIGKNICFLMNKKKCANIFGKLFIVSFLVFWFGFLIFWSYLVIKDNSYLSLLFTIPFWIMGIYIIKRFLLQIESKTIFQKIKMRFKFSIIVTVFLVFSSLIIGISCLFVGIRDTYKLNNITKNYITIDGYFIDYEVYSASKKNNDKTYKLNYIYKVDGKEYTVSTDYGVTSIPNINSIKKVQYNPNNPQESILSGTNSKNFLIYFGGFFTLVSIAFILGALYIKGIFDNLKIDIIGLYFGVVFLTVGIGIFFLQNGIKSSFLEMIKSFGLWIVIPFAFVIIGIFQIIKCLFLNHSSSSKRISVK